MNAEHETDGDRAQGRGVVHFHEYLPVRFRQELGHTLSLLNLSQRDSRSDTDVASHDRFASAALDTGVALMGVEFELIFGDIEHIVGRLVSPSDAREILSTWEERKGGELDLGAVLGDSVGPVLYAALERWHRLAIADPIRYVEFDRNRAVLNRFTCGLASSTAMGVATAPAAAMSSWAAAIAISGGLGGRHLGGR